MMSDSMGASTVRCMWHGREYCRISQNVIAFLQMPQPKANSFPVSGCSTPRGQTPSSWEPSGPAGHCGSSFARAMSGPTSGRVWQGWQKCVVPKQNHTATEQQYLQQVSQRACGTEGMWH